MNHPAQNVGFSGWTPRGTDYAAPALVSNSLACLVVLTATEREEESVLCYHDSVVCAGPMLPRHEMAPAAAAWVPPVHWYAAQPGLAHKRPLRCWHRCVPGSLALKEAKAHRRPLSLQVPRRARITGCRSCTPWSLTL